MNGLPPLPTIGEQQSLPLIPSPEAFRELVESQAATALAPLPVIPDRVTEWFPMRKPPWEAGEYDVRHDPRRGCTTEVITREYWDGFNWPGLRGKFTANAWRGLAQPKETK